MVKARRVHSLSSRFWPVVLGSGLVALGALASCETSDPCVLRQAACLDVSLIGNKSDATGAPIAYRDVSIKVCSGAANASLPCLEGQVAQGCTAELASSPSQTLSAVAAYSANVQGLVSFQLPSGFNDQVDHPPTEVDNMDAGARQARLKVLRDQDPRAVRILVTQTQARGTVVAWDSRCEEDRFSDDEWAKLKYYRVAKNEYLPVFALLRQAQTSVP